jgi:asparagine synthase (glutamine-hydrolysing)
MCGILGWIGTGASREKFSEHLGLLSHRGPDGAGVWEDRSQDVFLGHRRLAIIDLGPAGAQPMTDLAERRVIVFNGEIYNFQELRAELGKSGCQFRSHSDTEVLLMAYETWGEDCLLRLNGMFAFAIYDKGTPADGPHVFLARDRVGKKPLYYVHNGKSLRFASELKALGYDGGLDLRALNHYLAVGCYPGEMCLIEGVRKLGPGCAARFSPVSGKWTTNRWWKLPDLGPPVEGNPEELADELGNLLKDSVRLRLISDVPVGVFLSGGLDSSLVTAAAAQVSPTPVKTFTIRVPSAGFDESPYARLVADHFGTDHYELNADAGSLSVLDEMSPLLDEPLADSSLLPTFMVSRLTRKHVTVALGGDGGDELFAGYTHVRRALRALQVLGWVPAPVWRLTAALAARLPVGFKGRNRAVAWREGPLLERVLGTPYFDAWSRRGLFSQDALDILGPDIVAPEVRQREYLGKSGEPVQAIGHLDFCTTLPDDFLVKVDRASMMNSLEVRAPFLDPRLVEFAFRKVPARWKCDTRETRRIQRLLARRWLPESLDITRKQGFSVPLGQWFRDAGADAVRERLHGLPAVFDQKSVESQIRGHMVGRENGSRLFALAMLAACWRNRKGRF